MISNSNNRFHHGDGKTKYAERIIWSPNVVAETPRGSYFVETVK